MVGIRKSDHQMRPEEGKDGASRAPCAAFVSQPSRCRIRGAWLPPLEDAVQSDFEASDGGSVYKFRPLSDGVRGLPRRRVDDYPEFIIERNGKFYQEFRLVGFLFEIDGRWLRDPKRASKYPRTIARQIAAERGGVAVSVASAVKMAEALRAILQLFVLAHNAPVEFTGAVQFTITYHDSTAGKATVVHSETWNV